MNPTLTLIVYCALVVGASLAGGSIPAAMRLTHTRRQLLLSFVGGFMLSIAILHLLPHATTHVGSADVVGRWCLAGLVLTFGLLRIFHLHTPTIEAAIDPHPEHHHTHPHVEHEGAHPSKSWIGLALGFGFHSLIDGVALAAGVLAEWSGGVSGALLGFGTFTAIALHKPLDALVVTSVIRAEGRSKRAGQLVNAALALACPVGASLFYLGVIENPAGHSLIVGSALALTAGVFICISLSDILPEVRFHSHDRLVLSLALLAGVMLALIVGLFEADAAHAPERVLKHVH
jgi:zinc and cadmium transporter